jgi:6-hydroxy-3-succinoylpyridine 3-monooxygenase
VPLREQRILLSASPNITPRSAVTWAERCKFSPATTTPAPRERTPLSKAPAQANPPWSTSGSSKKQSDVALALHAFCDAVLEEIDQVVVMTNDSDFAPAMQMIRQHTNVVLGVIAPVRAGDGRSRVNRELDKHAHWTRTHILDAEFAASQLPPMVRLEGGAVHKPLSWYPCPELLLPVYEEARRLRGSNGAARRWLNEPCRPLGDRLPIEMCSSEESARELLEYLRRRGVECCV